jgi:hypothetical protein
MYAHDIMTVYIYAGFLFPNYCFLFFQHHFEMVDGVVHLYPSKDCK